MKEPNSKPYAEGFAVEEITGLERQLKRSLGEIGRFDRKGMTALRPGFSTLLRKVIGELESLSERPVPLDHTLLEEHDGMKLIGTRYVTKAGVLEEIHLVAEGYLVKYASALYSPEEFAERVDSVLEMVDMFVTLKKWVKAKGSSDTDASSGPVQAN